MNKSLPNSITVTFRYDKNIQKITGTSSEPAIISENMPFLFLLSTIFKSYPEIEKQYPPGALGLTVNGKPPLEFDIMHDGDVVTIMGF